MAASGEPRLVFGVNARQCSVHRPGHPEDAVSWALGLDRPARVLDLGAGTGKLSAAGLVRVAIQERAWWSGLYRQEAPCLD